ncbi:EAL domain-containing protein [Yokenella regensburgei]|uniref:EAL domain-containing protein n=1 Tax=Yokenella regensburgei TaxID=158877 RepID=UPI003F177C6F
MKVKMNKNVRTFIIALIICLFIVPFSRIISPVAVVDSSPVYLTWLPLSIMFSVLLLFGRRAVLPIIISFAVVNQWLLNLTLMQASILLFCQLLPAFAACAIVRWKLGSRWRHGIPNKNMGLRIFLLGFATPLAIKALMYIAGRWFSFPVYLSSYFGSASVVYTIIDIQNLICAALIFTMMFYYPLRMILNPRYGRAFWLTNIKPCISKKNRLFTFSWLSALITLLSTLCSYTESDYIAGYLVPVIFIIFTLAVSKLRYPLIMLLWPLSAFTLLSYNHHFLEGVNTEYSLAFIMSVLICFSICLIYMTRIHHRNEWIKRRWQEQALTDPLTGLPNLRALELCLAEVPDNVVCCLHMHNLEFLSRHYGMMMRVHFKRSVTRELQPFLLRGEQLFQLPGSELILVLKGEGAVERLHQMVAHLNSRRIYWHNDGMDVEFGASWGEMSGAGETLHHTLGQLSWLSEQASMTRQVMALTLSLSDVSLQTSARVHLLHQVKRALDENGLVLYAQPIQDANGNGYHEILTRLMSDNRMLSPAQFIPVIARFNLSLRFDMHVFETLLQWMHAHPAPSPAARFSVNLLPLTLMQEDAGQKLVERCARYAISPGEIIIEVTEEQAFSNAETSIKNIQRLRQAGFRIAIDDFGTGYANFERLKRLEADIIKIDGCFVRDITEDPQDMLIVKAICELAKAKSLTVVAEYVESQAQRELLLQAGVDYLQGYLLGKPQPLKK